MLRKESLSKEFFLMVCVCSFLAILHSLSFASKTKEPSNAIKLSTKDFSITLVGEEFSENAPHLKRFHLEIFDKGTKEFRHLTIGDIHSRVRSIKSIYPLRNNLLIIFGNLKRAEIVFIVNLWKGQLIDEFWCYDPVLSPSEHYLVYEKFYPYHGLPGSQTTVVLLYDLQKSPSENRIPVEGYTSWPESQVGLPVYPEPYVKAQAYVLPEQQLENPNWYSLTSPFLWHQDSNDIVFLCNHEGQTNIARVNISDGVKKPKIYEAAVNVADFIKPDLQEELREKEVARLRRLSAEDITWDGKEYVIIKPDRAYRTLRNEFRLSVP